MNQILTAFDILGISPDSDDATIRTAWRALVRTYHPDMAKSDPVAANKRLAEINAAHDAVPACTEEEKRKIRAEFKRRAQAAAQAKREQERRRREARSAHREGDDPRTNAKRTTAHQQAHQQAHQHAQSAQAAAGRAHRPAQGDPQAVSGLSQMAARAFQTAQVVCSKERKVERRSTYY
mgnify:CR=1 FL=1